MQTSEFKDFMACVPTCVAVVTTLVYDEIRGCTISSLTSFDIENPGVMIVLKSHSKTLAAIRKSGNFVASILNQNQVTIAKQFSSREKDSLVEKIELFDFKYLPSMPFLKSCQGAVFCELEKIVELDNASLVFGRVITLLNSGDNSPLLYFKRGYFALGNSSI